MLDVNIRLFIVDSAGEITPLGALVDLEKMLVVKSKESCIVTLETDTSIHNINTLSLKLKFECELTVSAFLEDKHGAVILEYYNSKECLVYLQTLKLLQIIKEHDEFNVQYFTGNPINQRNEEAPLYLNKSNNNAKIEKVLTYLFQQPTNDKKSLMSDNPTQEQIGDFDGDELSGHLYPSMFLRWPVHPDTLIIEDVKVVLSSGTFDITDLPQEDITIKPSESVRLVLTLPNGHFNYNGLERCIVEFLNFTKTDEYCGTVIFDFVNTNIFEIEQNWFELCQIFGESKQGWVYPKMEKILKQRQLENTEEDSPVFITEESQLKVGQLYWLKCKRWGSIITGKCYSYKGDRYFKERIWATDDNPQAFNRWEIMECIPPECLQQAL